MYFVYVLENSADRSWYVGFTTNVERRVQEHNDGSGARHTRKRPGRWQLIYQEGYLDKGDTLAREIFLKSGAGRAYLKKQLNNYLGA